MSHNLWQLHFDKAQLAFHVSQFWLYGNEYYLSQMICLWTEFLQSKTFFSFCVTSNTQQNSTLKFMTKNIFSFWIKVPENLANHCNQKFITQKLYSSPYKMSSKRDPSKGSCIRGFSRKYLFMSIHIKESSRHKATLYVFEIQTYGAYEYIPRSVIILNVAISWVCCHLQLERNGPGFYWIESLQSRFANDCPLFNSNDR